MTSLSEALGMIHEIFSHQEKKKNRPRNILPIVMTYMQITCRADYRIHFTAVSVQSHLRFAILKSPISTIPSTGNFVSTNLSALASSFIITIRAF